MDASPAQIREAFGKVPRPIREFIAEDGLSDTTVRLAQQYGLHVDTAGTLNQLMTYVLLGFLDPANLPQELSARIQLSQEQVPGFIKDLNESIFIPLQKKVREAEPELSHDERVRQDMPKKSSVGYRTQSPSPTVAVPQISAREPEPSVSESRPLENQVPSFNLIRPNVIVSAPTHPIEPTLAPAVQMRTMQHDIQTLQNPQVPPLMAPHAPSMPHPSQVTPARSFQTASVPFTSVPQQRAQPVQVPHQVIQPPLAHPPSPPISIPQTPATNDTSADPYREPI